MDARTELAGMFMAAMIPGNRTWTDTELAQRAVEKADLLLEALRPPNIQYTTTDGESHADYCTRRLNEISDAVENAKVPWVPE